MHYASFIRTTPSETEETKIGVILYEKIATH